MDRVILNKTLRLGGKKSHIPRNESRQSSNREGNKDTLETQISPSRLDPGQEYTNVFKRSVTVNPREGLMTRSYSKESSEFKVVNPRFKLKRELP